MISSIVIKCSAIIRKSAISISEGGKKRTGFNEAIAWQKCEYNLNIANA